MQQYLVHLICLMAVGYLCLRWWRRRGSPDPSQCDLPCSNCPSAPKAPKAHEPQSHCNR